MRAALLAERDETVAAAETPHLSHSRVNRYLHCPEQYRLYYVENLRPRAPAASLVFGQVLHQALAHLFHEKGDAHRFFLEAWRDIQRMDLTYGSKDTWDGLLRTGKNLLTKFVEEELPKIGAVHASERAFTLDITSLEVPFVGVIDLVADVESKRTVVDFKTSASAYKEHEVLMSDQLTAYQMAEPDAERAALCVLVKTKEPQIEWHVASRGGDRLTEYLAKAGYVGREITSGRFYKRPGLWCSWCDFLPVCLGDRKRAEETLVRIR